METKVVLGGRKHQKVALIGEKKTLFIVGLQGVILGYF